MRAPGYVPRLVALEAQLAKLADRVAILERDCPHARGAADDRERLARQRSVAEAEQRAREKREQLVRAEVKRDAILVVKCADGGKAHRVCTESTLARQLKLVGPCGIRHDRQLRRSEWDALCREHADDYRDLMAEGAIAVRPLDIDHSGAAFEQAAVLVGAA